ncbi:unnamed protein product, partial [Ectocarpus fasciculatus]
LEAGVVLRNEVLRVKLLTLLFVQLAHLKIQKRPKTSSGSGCCHKRSYVEAIVFRLPQTKLSPSSYNEQQQQTRYRKRGWEPVVSREFAKCAARIQNVLGKPFPSRLPGPLRLRSPALWRTLARRL